MAAKEYLPRNEAELVKWSTNFAAQFATVGPNLGYTAGDVTAMTSATTEINTAIADADAAKLVYEEKVANKKTVVETRTATVREMVRRIKVAPGYTESVGKLLGIIGEGSTFDPNNAQPVITLVKGATGWDFKYNLQNYFTGVTVFRRKPGEADFTKVDVDLKPPYSIPTPTENGVEYIFQYLKDDRLTGLPSDIIKVSL